MLSEKVETIYNLNTLNFKLVCNCWNHQWKHTQNIVKKINNNNTKNLMWFNISIKIYTYDLKR